MSFSAVVLRLTGQEGSQRGSPAKQLLIGLVLLVVAIYSATLLRNLREKDRRSLQLKEMPMEGNYVGVSFQVISVDLAESELTARMSFRLNGDLAKDPITPAEDLTLFLNGIRGSQEIDFPRGRRINPIEAAFPSTAMQTTTPSIATVPKSGPW